MSYIKHLKRKIKNLQATVGAKKEIIIFEREMKEHFKSLFEAGLSEFQFERLQKDLAKNIIDEIDALDNIDIIKRVIDNYRERQALDTIIHNRKIYEQQK